MAASSLPELQPLLYGCFAVVEQKKRKYLPLIRLDAHAKLLAYTSRTTLTQTFVNPDCRAQLDEVHYDFPLYDGVSVVGFTCTVGGRLIKGVVKERQAARKSYDDALRRGVTTAMLKQLDAAADAFTTTIGNVPPGQEVTVRITYLGELEHDAEADAMVRFTIPTAIAPRYGGGETVAGSNAIPAGRGTISITVDAELANGCSISSIRSPSHPISVSVGTPSATHEPPLLRRASASLSLGSAELGKDFVVQVVAAGLGNPTAILETHPAIPNQRALMATLVPKFSLPAEKSEIVFVCDRSGSMGAGQKIPNLIAALQIFLKSLPVGARFNICSFGSIYSYLWDKAQLYDQESLDNAVNYVKSFSADYGGTEMYQPLEETFKRRHADMNLEVFLLTDGEIWEQAQLFSMIDHHVSESRGAIRVFTLGVGDDASSALIQGVARAGNGFAQKVAEDEKMDKKIVRMLKGALTPHINDYALEITYAKTEGDDGASEDDFEMVERLMGSRSIQAETDDDDKVKEPTKPAEPEPAKEPISMSNADVRDKDLQMPHASATIDANFSDLPTVEPPRYLQTPFKIPALFPFNRSTVYVMLSDSTPNCVPKSVVLTGTCAHGPLRLEIPLTTLAEKGDTIHQLAARKAVQELEEGRGWIVHAKDGNGKLLKKEFEGQFERMVQREGVRLGVEYQVAGKWCSFVAVQQNKGKDDDGEKGEEILGEMEVVSPWEEPSAQPMMYAYDLEAMNNMELLAMSRRAFKTTESSPEEFAKFGEGRVTMPLFGSTALPSVPAAFGPASAPEGFAGLGGGPASTPLFGSAAPPSASGFVVDGGAEASAEAAPDGGFGGTVSLGPRSDYRTLSSSGHERAATNGDDTLAILVVLQTFIGSWAWSRELERVTCVTRQKVAELSLPTKCDDQADIAATLCAVVFLRKKLADEKDAWELMVDKAENWLEEQTGETASSLEKILEDAGLFGTQ